MSWVGSGSAVSWSIHTPEDNHGPRVWDARLRQGVRYLGSQHRTRGPWSRLRAIGAVPGPVLFEGTWAEPGTDPRTAEMAPRRPERTRYAHQ